MQENSQRRPTLDEIFGDNNKEHANENSMTVSEYQSIQEGQQTFIEKHHLNDIVYIAFIILIIFLCIILGYVVYKIIRLIGKLYSKLDRWLEKDRVKN